MVYKHRLCIQDLTKTEHDMYIMGMTMACMGIPTERHDGKERKKQRAKYRFWVNNSLVYNKFKQLHNIKPIFLGKRSLRHCIFVPGKHDLLSAQIYPQAHDGSRGLTKKSWEPRSGTS